MSWLAGKHIDYVVSYGYHGPFVDPTKNDFTDHLCMRNDKTLIRLDGLLRAVLPQGLTDLVAIELEMGRLLGDDWDE